MHTSVTYMSPKHPSGNIYIAAGSIRAAPGVVCVSVLNLKEKT